MRSRGVRYLAGLISPRHGFESRLRVYLGCRARRAVEAQRRAPPGFCICPIVRGQWGSGFRDYSPDDEARTLRLLD